MKDTETKGFNLAKEAREFVGWKEKTTSKKKPWSIKHVVIACLVGGFLASGKVRTAEEALKEAELYSDKIRDL